MVLQYLCIDPKASDKHHRATEYCKTQWFCKSFGLLYRSQIDTPGQQNTVKHYGFATILHWSKGLSRITPCNRILETQWFRSNFALIQRPLTDIPGQQNTVEHNGFVTFYISSSLAASWNRCIFCLILGPPFSLILAHGVQNGPPMARTWPRQWPPRQVLERGVIFNAPMVSPYHVCVMDLQHLCIDQHASDRQHWPAEYCKRQWLCNIFALIQRPLTDDPGQQNTVKHNGFVTVLLCSKGLRQAPLGNRTL